jgi:hypothetical protein
MNNSTQVTDKGRLSFIMLAMENWSKSITQLMVPSDLVTECDIEEVADLSGQFIECTLLFGERKGKKDDLPYDGGGVNNKITDLSIESLWIYGENTFDEIPSEFDVSKGLFSSKWKSIYIGTGKTHKCPSCRGRGLVKCTNCNGRGRYESTDWDNNKVWRDCSCGNGLKECQRCSGYGTVEDVIKCSTNYHIHAKSGLIYSEDFENKSSEQTISMVSKTTGKTMLDTVIEFPVEDMLNILKGGADSSGYLQLQNVVRGKVKDAIDEELDRQANCDTQAMYNTFCQLFDILPSPVQINNVLEHEILPVRLRVIIQKRPIFKVRYTYRKQPYFLWVYGDEGKVYASIKPKEFTKKAKILIMVVGILIVVGIIVAVIMGTNSIPLF